MVKRSPPLRASRSLTDHSRLALRTETEKSLSYPKIADEVIESNLLGEEGKCPANLRAEMKDTMMHHRRPRPTVRTRSFQRRCAKETMEVTISQKILLKHVATSQGH